LPLTIVAKQGQIIQDPSVPNSVLIRLYDGDIHRKGEAHTKIKFDSYDMKIMNEVINENREKSSPSLTIDEISKKLDEKNLSEDDRRSLLSEYHKRWAVSILCIVFGLLGVGLGTNTNRRTQKSGGLVLSLGVIVGYWILYVSAEGLARGGQIPVALAIWFPNFIFAGLAAWKLKQNWN
jgi:lipopolysaccharide export system permease protein